MNHLCGVDRGQRECLLVVLHTLGKVFVRQVVVTDVKVQTGESSDSGKDPLMGVLYVQIRLP